ncbi:GntR family transcriptional regulator [Streptomyces daqingensis]|uniref:GntR family transcriptional regulator n=1 Tax=Streptomyces daqingensis TaxID=1472640 RepID=A0ABQ2MQV0_9ACTN|nr:GntR family transcriptional regulator [Streptomyces daqingensis]GGO56266.1 GntR family transcriptional regulator [Streptomyces daqingensis]
MAEIQRPGALYRQVAAAIRDGIAGGEYPSGTPLPSESQLIDRYQVSRPTVRNAIAALRAEGLIEVIHGKGSFVRSAPVSSITVDRTVTRDCKGNFYAGFEAWKLLEEPSVSRSHTDSASAPLLELDEGEAVFVVDRLWEITGAGVRLAHRILIPFATAENTELAESPDTDPARAYAILAESGHELAWSERASARMPLPDERAALQLPDATPVLHTTRITYGRENRPLLLEELRTNGNLAQAAYRITATTPRQLAAVPD